MKNNFKENLNKKIVSDISNGTILGLQQQLSSEARIDIGNIYDAFKAIEQSKTPKLAYSHSRRAATSRGRFDYGLALNIFMQKFLMENKAEIENLRFQYIEKQRNELGIKDTSNQNFYVDREGCYYTFDYDKYIEQPDIVDVDNEGNYTTKEEILNAEYNVFRYFTKDDSVKYLYVVDKRGQKLTKSTDVIRILKLKKEVVKKIKRIGYCGKSFDFWADLLNMFYVPSETGYYSDNKYNFYRWDCKNFRFIRQLREGLTPGAPDISDYETKDSKTIVRTDYNGSGLGLQFA